jgi:hypothetical protein
MTSLLFNAEVGAFPWPGTVGCSGGVGFLLFGGATGALPWEGLCLALGLCALWEGKPPGIRRIAKCGAWDSLAYVVVGS